MYADYHTHLGSDANGLADGRPYGDVMREFVRKAAEVGLGEIGFTEHSPKFKEFRDAVPPEERCYWSSERLADYVNAAETLKELGQPVRLGVEVEYYKDKQAEISRFVPLAPWDYVTVGLHRVDDWDFTMEAMRHRWASADVRAVWEAYFPDLWAAVDTGLFDVVAHADVVKVLGKFHPDRNRIIDLMEETAERLSKAGTCVEVNTAGLRRPVGRVYPEPELLRACARRGVGVVLGSDSHGPEYVGYAFREAVGLLRAAGVRELTLFDSRRRRAVPLPE